MIPFYLKLKKGDRVKANFTYYRKTYCLNAVIISKSEKNCENDIENNEESCLNDQEATKTADEENDANDSENSILFSF